MKDTQVLHNHSKLITVTRRDISPGYQAVQAAHAAINFQHEFPSVSKEWNDCSNYLVFLSTENEQSLEHLIEKAKCKDIKYTVFREPDIDNQITAVAFEPSDAARKLCSKYPLMLKNDFDEKDKQINELLECVQNLMGLFDTPIARRKLNVDTNHEAIKIGREILNVNQ